MPIRWNPSDPPVACGVYGAGFDVADPATTFGVGRLQSARMGSEVCNACSYWLEHAGPLPQAKLTAFVHAKCLVLPWSLRFLSANQPCHAPFWQAIRNDSGIKP